MSNVKIRSQFITKKCPICKNNFIQTTGEWCYKKSIGTKMIYYCSYSCMNKGLEKRKPNPCVKYYDLYDNDKIIEKNVTIKQLYDKGYEVDKILNAGYKNRLYKGRYYLEKR